MDNALLDFCLGKYSFDCLRESGKAVYAGDQNILNATIFKAIQDGKPEFCTFILTNIHTQYVFMTVHVDTNSDIDCPFYDTSFMTNMIVYRIHENNCIYLFPEGVPAILLR